MRGRTLLWPQLPKLIDQVKRFPLWGSAGKRRDKPSNGNFFGTFKRKWFIIENTASCGAMVAARGASEIFCSLKRGSAERGKHLH